MALGQQSQSSPNAPPEQPPASQDKSSNDAEPASPKGDAQAGDQTPVLDPDTELRATVQQSAGDNAKLIQNLQAYLERHPDTPRRGAIYRGMMQAALQMNDPKRALEFADKAVAIQPDDSQTLYLAVTALEKMPDDASQARAIEYDTRLIALIAKANPESRPAQMSLEEWQAGRNKFTNELYVLRGASKGGCTRTMRPLGISTSRSAWCPVPMPRSRSEKLRNRTSTQTMRHAITLWP